MVVGEPGQKIGCLYNLLHDLATTSSLHRCKESGLRLRTSLLLSCATKDRSIVAWAHGSLFYEESCDPVLANLSLENSRRHGKL